MVELRDGNEKTSSITKWVCANHFFSRSTANFREFPFLLPMAFIRFEESSSLSCSSHEDA